MMYYRVCIMKHCYHRRLQRKKIDVIRLQLENDSINFIPSFSFLILLSDGRNRIMVGLQVSNSLKWLLLIGITIDVAICIIIVALTVFIFLAIKKSTVEIQKASDELPKVLDSLAYAELPMPVICAMTTYFKIDIKDVVKAYKKDAGERKKLVLDAFHMDKVTKTFLETYDSKFVAHGYMGEQLLKGL